MARRLLVRNEWAYMGNGKELDNATERLTSALKAMEDAVAAKRHSELTIDSLEEQVQSLKTNLEAERRKNENLTTANQEATERIDSVIESIKDIMKDS